MDVVQVIGWVTLFYMTQNLLVSFLAYQLMA